MHFRNASWSGLAAAIRAITGLLGALLAVRLLGTGQYGQVATWLSLFVLYLSLNASAFTMLAVKLVVSSKGDRKMERDIATSAAVAFCAGSVMLLAVTTALLGTFVSMRPQFDGVLGAEFGSVIFMMGMLTAMQIVVALQAAVIEGSGRLDLATKWQLVGPLVIAGLLAYSFFSASKIDAFQYVAILAVGAFTDMCLLWIRRRSLVLPLWIPKGSSRLVGVLQLLRSGGVLQATSLLNLFLEPANKFILNYFVGAAAVAIYDLAMKVIWGIQHLVGASMRVFLYIGSEDRDAVGENFVKVIVMLGVPVITMHIFGALFLFWTAHYWMMIDAGPMMAFFAIAAISNLGMIFVTPLYFSLIGKRDLIFIFRIQAVLAVVNISVCGVLIPFLGLIGSAFGLLLATLVNATAIYARCRLETTVFAAQGNAIARAKRRISMAIGLLAATILWCGFGNDSVIPVMGILIGLAALMPGEPLVRRVLDQVVSKRA